MKFEKPLSELSVLVAEDDPDDFFLLKCRANELGVLVENIINVTSLKSAKAELRQGDFDIVLLDLGLQDSSGLNTFISLDKSNPETPKIVLSGCSDVEIARSAVRLGAQDYIFKNNIPSCDLVEKIYYAIERHTLLNKLREHSTFKSKFLAQMSHEIRTPMNGVIGLTDILRSSPNLSTEEKDVVETLGSCGRHLINLISDILDVSKIESGKMELESKEFEVRGLVNDTMSLFTQKAAEKGVTLSTLVEPNVPSHVVCDRGRLGQVLSNLVGNAVKFTQEGHVSLNITYNKKSEIRGLFRFEVSDTGPGIPESIRSTLFCEYQQAAFNATDSGVRGTGLGLAICKGLAGKMGGEIGVESQVGKGSTFWIEIELMSKKIQSTSRSNLEGIVAIVASTSAERAAIIKAQLSLRKIKSVTRSPLEDNWELDFPNPEQADIVILDACGFSEKEVTAWIDRVRSSFCAVDTPILLISDQTHFTCGLRHTNLVRLNGYLNQSRMYKKIAWLLGSESPQVCEHNPRPKSDISGLKVLVADDNEVNRKVAVKMLELLGCTPIVAKSGRDAIKLARTEQPNVILMDCQMPDVDGFEATKAIRSMPGNVSKTPIFALTANGYAEDKVKARKFGMDGFITKPIVTEDLERALSPIKTGASGPGRSVTSHEIKTSIDTFLPEQKTIDTLHQPTLDLLKSLEDPEDETPFLDDLITTFETQAPEIIEKLKGAIDSGNPRGVEHLAHKLKGFSRNLGASRLTMICDMIEANASELIESTETKVAARVEYEFNEALASLNKHWRKKSENRGQP